MTGANRNFACSQCGACCNRAPEVELGETAALADVFVWQLLFRLYSLSRAPAAGESAAQFYEAKRLLGRFAAYSYEGKAIVAGRKQPRTFYLSVSALALDLGTGTCAALQDRRCGIYTRRPLTCRTVPLHYSRAAAGAAADFDAFVSSPGYACDSRSSAAPLLADGQIVAPEIVAARADASAQAELDQPWKAAIIKAMKKAAPDLPSLTQIEQNAAYGALSVPMRSGWHVALQAGLMEPAVYDAAVANQEILLNHLARSQGLGSAAAQSIADLRQAYSASQPR